MKKTLLLFVVICYSFNITGQSSPTDFDFGSASNFILFSGVGAVANTGTSSITGDVGSNVGAIAGFGLPTVFNGTIENDNAVTAQATLDLIDACSQIQNTTTTIGDHSPIFGSLAGDTIYPGVYAIASAASISGMLALDAQGDPNAMFVFKITGALTSVAGSEMSLINGTTSDNIYWLAVGAVALGANSIIAGTLISNPGAISLGAGSDLDGRLYSTTGAIAINSNVATIPTFTTDSPVSSANNGGLESNNRLSDKINNRNYNRVKTNYSFDKTKAKRVVRSSDYSQKKSSFELGDFIPLNTINEDYLVESTPIDLVGITNAVDVYGADYIKNNNSAASILILKTDNGVYEHTKYICDRLLGAELMDVSTIEILGHNFIKAIIKNTEGTLEHVLSFSAKEINNNQNFAIENHWNLDKYESDVMFYNFQIWSNSIDDLLLLSEEVLNLLAIQKPVSSYHNSTPPTVFVRKGSYINGALDLQIVNTNGSEIVAFDAGLRVTETSDLNYLNSTIYLNENYITNLQFETGSLFDIGFRISDGFGTPDDVFISDGSWGFDDSAVSTEIEEYSVLANTIDFDPNDFSIERNIELNATTTEYVAVYRSLTPRFDPINLSEYSNFKLRAKGTGEMQINFIKKSISTWEEQPSATILLTDNFQDFTISCSDFTNMSSSELMLDDIITVVFTMISEDGTSVTKEMAIQDVRFSNTNTVLSVSTFDDVSSKIVAIPNPMDSNTTIYFSANQSETIQFVVHDQLGKMIYQRMVNCNAGVNQVQLNKQNLGAGFYFCSISSSQSLYKTLNLIVR